MRRPPFQPPLERNQRMAVAAGTNFHAAVLEIDRVTLQVQGFGDIPGTRPEKYALHPAGYFEQAAHAGLLRRGLVGVFGVLQGLECA